MTPSDIRSAHARIRGHIRRTPILETSSPIAGAPPISLKLECLQHTGSFKARGAFHNLLTRPAPAAGCATASGGNHGAAVAFAAQKLGIRARIFVPEIAAPAKIAKIKAYGAEAMIGGASYAEAQERCDAYVAESGALSIHPYDAVETIAGQGTVALEWEEDLERLALTKLDTVLVAVGGGGLIAGIAAWFAGRVKVVGVEPEGSRALHAALEANAPVDVDGQVDRRQLARREAGRRTQFRDRPAVRERGRPGHGHGDRRGAAPPLGRRFGGRRAWRRGGLRRPRKRRLSARSETSGSACSSAAPTPIWRRSRQAEQAATPLRDATCGKIARRPLRWARARTIVRPLSAGPDQSCGSLGRSQVVRQRILIPRCGGSNPPAPATQIARSSRALRDCRREGNWFARLRDASGRGDSSAAEASSSHCQAGAVGLTSYYMRKRRWTRDGNDAGGS